MNLEDTENVEMTQPLGLISFKIRESAVFVFFEELKIILKENDLLDYVTKAPHYCNGNLSIEFNHIGSNSDKAEKLIRSTFAFFTKIDQQAERLCESINNQSCFKKLQALKSSVRDNFKIIFDLARQPFSKLLKLLRWETQIEITLSRSERSDLLCALILGRLEPQQRIELLDSLPGSESLEKKEHEIELKFFVIKIAEDKWILLREENKKGNKYFVPVGIDNKRVFKEITTKDFSGILGVLEIKFIDDEKETLDFQDLLGGGKKKDREKKITPAMKKKLMIKVVPSPEKETEKKLRKEAVQRAYQAFRHAGLLESTEEFGNFMRKLSDQLKQTSGRLNFRQLLVEKIKKFDVRSADCLLDCLLFGVIDSVKSIDLIGTSIGDFDRLDFSDNQRWEDSRFFDRLALVATEKSIQVCFSEGNQRKNYTSSYNLQIAKIQCVLALNKRLEKFFHTEKPKIKTTGDSGVITQLDISNDIQDRVRVAYLDDLRAELLFMSPSELQKYSIGNRSDAETLQAVGKLSSGKYKDLDTLTRVAEENKFSLDLLGYALSKMDERHENKEEWNLIDSLFRDIKASAEETRVKKLLIFLDGGILPVAEEQIS